MERLHAHACTRAQATWGVVGVVEPTRSEIPERPACQPQFRNECCVFERTNACAQPTTQHIHSHFTGHTTHTYTINKTTLPRRYIMIIRGSRLLDSATSRRRAQSQPWRHPESAKMSLQKQGRESRRANCLTGRVCCSAARCC
jgi:hypothetical protein